MLKNWWFYLIIAVVVIIIAIPVATITRLNNSIYDLNYTYVQLDDPLSTIVKKYTYYDAANKTVEIELNQDIINSLIEDQLKNAELALPDKLSIDDVMFKTVDQRVYINAKYGKLNVPLSAKININTNSEGINISIDSFMLGSKKAPRYVTKRIPADMLQFAVNYDSLNVPQVFSVKSIDFGSGSICAVIQLDEESLKDTARSFRNDLLASIQEYKAQQSDTVKTFIDKIIDGGALSDAKVNSYVEQILNNEELVNSALLFAVASDLDKYPKGLDKYRQSLMDWSAPLQEIKYYGSIEDTIDNILYNDNIKELLTWFIPAQSINEYVSSIDSYYTTYKDAESSLTSLGNALGAGDIETAVNQVINDRDLYKLLTMLFPSNTVDEYLQTTEQYYNTYTDVLAQVDNTLAMIPEDEMNEYVSQLLEFANSIDESKKALLDGIEDIDTELVTEIVTYIDQDDGLLKTEIARIDPAYYDEFMAYVDNLDANKQLIYSSIADIDTTQIYEAADKVEEVASFINGLR